MKWVITVIVLLLLGAVGFSAFNSYIYRQKQGDTAANVTPTQAPATVGVTPISHASFVLNMAGQIIYNDPVDAALFRTQPDPNIILISDIHGDHLDLPTITAISNKETILVVPQAVADMLPKNLEGIVIVLENGAKTKQRGIEIEAVPMYNVPETADARHTKGRGNGYIVSAEGKRVYIAGDSGPTPEMQALQNIDVAFVPMNPPFTMTVDEAANAVVAFKPKIVHPYHYRGQAGLSDVNTFKDMVTAGDPNITVELLNFYPEE